MSTKPIHRLLPAITLAISLALPAGFPAVLQAAGSSAQTISVKLGDYRYRPDRLEVTAGTPVILQLTNTDRITPHNFTLKHEQAGFNLDIDIVAGKTQKVIFTPVRPGNYTFFCNKKLLFFKSHREHGMEGTLVIHPAQQESHHARSTGFR